MKNSEGRTFKGLLKNVSKMRTEDLDEAIKGWNHAAPTLAKYRQAERDSNKEHKLVRLKKDGSESKMRDAIKHFNSEEEVMRYHENMERFNPGHKIKYNYYVRGQLVKSLD